MSVRRSAVAVAAALALVLAACGDDGGENVSADSDEATEEDGHDEALAFGAPADPGDAVRTVEVVMTDDFAFEPDAIEVEAGEVVTFELVNDGSIPHDFTIGDLETQDEHEMEMAEADPSEADGGHDANAITVAGGERASITWEFADPGEEVLFGCHIPGHYDAGMVGDFVID